MNGKTAYTPYVFAAKDPNSGVMTTFVPIWYVMQVMNKAGVTNSWNGVTHTLTLGGKNATLSIHGTKGDATITLNGKAVESGVPSFAVVDPNSGSLTTFFGLYYAEKMLDAMGFSNAWNGTKHTWTMTLPTSSGTKTYTNSTGQTVTVSAGSSGEKGSGTSSAPVNDGSNNWSAFN